MQSNTFIILKTGYSCFNKYKHLLLQQLLYDEEVVFKNRMDLIEQDRLIHIESLRINGLRYTNKYEYINNNSNVISSDNKNNNVEKEKGKQVILLSVNAEIDKPHQHGHAEDID